MNKEQKIKEQKIKELENSINNAESSIKQAKEQIEQLKKENDFKLPGYIQNYEKYKWFINQVVNNYVLRDILMTPKQYALLKLQYIADKLNGDWKVDFEDINQKAYYIYYHITDEKFLVNYELHKYVAGIYFKSRELAEKALEIMDSEIEYLKG